MRQKTDEITMYTNHFQFMYALMFLVSALVFAVTGLTFIIAMLIRRTLYRYRQRRYKSLCDEFQKTLDKLIILEKSKNNLSHYSLDFYLKDLGRKITSSFSKQLLIDLLIASKQNLKGDSVILVREIYIRLHLKRYSCLKLTNYNLIKKIQGLQELAEMECYDMLPAIQALLTHRKVIVQQEGFIAVVRLASESPFALVDHYKGPITSRMQLTIHKHLNSIPSERLPKFWKWFYSGSKDIRKFAITMSHQFMQLESIPHLVHLLESQDLETAGMAAEVLGELGAVQHADAIANLGKKHPVNEPLSLKVIAALAHIGNAEAHGVFLAWHMNHSSHRVRIEVIDAMQMLKLNYARLL